MQDSTKCCSKCKKEKPLTDFYKRKAAKDGVNSWCKECFNKSCIERWIRRKIEMVKHYGGKCLDCSITLEDSHYSIFDFHHRDPSQKDMDWTKLRLTSRENIIKELDKCDLLCANCHRIRHVKSSEGFPDQPESH